MKSRGLKGGEAELLLTKWLRMNGWTVHRAARAGFVRLPNGKAFCQSHDLFGCIDILAIRAVGEIGTWAIQVTTQGGRTARRRKIEAVTAWPADWSVSLVSHEAVESPVNRARHDHYWRIEHFGPEPGLTPGLRLWHPPSALVFDLKAVEADAKVRRSEAGA